MARKELAYTTIDTGGAPSPATSGTTATVVDGSLLYVGLAALSPVTGAPTKANTEVIDITDITGDVITFTRAQNDTTAQSVADGWRVYQGVFGSEIDDIIDRIVALEGAGSGDPHVVVNTAGVNAVADGLRSIAIGGAATTSTHTDSVAIGEGASVGGTMSVAIGRQASTAAGNSVAIGRAAYAAVINTLVVGYASYAWKQHDTVLGDSAQSSSGGSGYNTVIGRNAQAGSNSSGRVVIGTNSSSFPSVNSNNSVHIGHNVYMNNSNTVVSIGYNSLAYGTGTIAIGASQVQGNYSVGIGGGTSFASGANAMAEYTTAVGVGSTATSGAQRSTAIGYNAHVEFPDATAIGSRARTMAAGDFSIGAGYFSEDADVGLHFIQLRGTTTNATETEIKPGGSTSSIPINSNNAFYLDIDIIGHKQSTYDQTGVYNIKAVISKEALNSSLAIDSITKTVIFEDDAAWDVDLEVDTTSGSIKLMVTGAASTTIRWQAVAKIINIK